MNKEIKMIELIDMYVEDVVQPKKVKFDGNVYIYNGNSVLQQIINEYKGKIVFLLNEKVEVLEEDKDIELLDVALLSQSDNWLWCPSKDDFEKDIELNAYIISNIRENTLNFQRKLNEVIKEVNKLRKENNNG